MRAVPLLLLLPLCLPRLHAQTAVTEPSPDPGTVSGHVVCDDTQRPARMALVRLVPAPSAKTVTADDGGDLSPIETDLNGDFTVHNVRPGHYIVRVDLPGYITSIQTFDPKQLAHPDPEVQQRMAAELDTVDVRPHTEVHADLTLHRGATLEGTVRYDDGSPAIGLGMQLLTRHGDEGWQPLNNIYGNTDGRGRYRFSSLEPGTYLVQANLSLSEYSNSVMPSPSGDGTTVHMSMQKTTFSLPVYSGSMLRRSEGTPIAVEAGQSSDGNDLTVPISKLHHVSGEVLAPDGHPVNAAKVVLRWPDDRTEVTSVDLDRNSRRFSLPYVPEGTFTLSAENARDVAVTQVPNAPGVVPHLRNEEHIQHRYGAADQPLIVQTDIDGVIAKLPDASNKPLPSNATN